MEKRKIHRLTYPMIGFTTDEGLLLDLDHYSLKYVQKIADTFLTPKYHYSKPLNLEGYLIVETSKNCYNVIYNKYLKWKDVLTLLGKVYFYLGGKKTKHGKVFGEWLILQVIKQACTVRISPKGYKLKPKILLVKGKTDKLINDYLNIYDNLGGENES